MLDSNTIDIHSKGEYPSCALSNFAEYEFCVDNVKCLSMEGFLQSLKFRNVKKQKQVCLLSGKDAKNSTRHTIAQLRWRITHNLYWQGNRINRFSDEYQKLLDKVYFEFSKNADFIKALDETAEKELVHSIGKTDTRKTVLTEYELIFRLNSSSTSSVGIPSERSIFRNSFIPLIKRLHSKSVSFGLVFLLNIKMTSSYLVIPFYKEVCDLSNVWKYYYIFRYI